MAIRDDLQQRVNRLRRGVFRNEDVSTLYVNLRETYFFRESFRDIGNFVAHRERRDQGAVHGITRDMARFLRYSVHLSLKDASFQLSAAEVAATLKSNLNLLDDEFLERDLGMKRADARSHLGGALKRIGGLRQKRLVVTRALNPKQAAVVNYLSSKLRLRPAYDGEKLFDDFCHVLIRNGYLAEAEIPDLAHAKAALSLFASAHMHGSLIELDDGQTAELKAGCDDMAGVHVRAGIEVKGVTVSVVVFMSGLDPRQHCDEALLHEPDQSRMWEMPVELRPDRKLGLIEG